MVSQMLEREGHEVVEAANGVQGLDSYTEDNTDVILLDMVMPKRDGLMTLQDLLASFPRARVIAMSGGSRGRASWLPIAQRAGAVGILKKPFTKDQLMESLEAALTNPWK
jgi:CheY-like chemotaxis protein